MVIYRYTYSNKGAKKMKKLTKIDTAKYTRTNVTDLHYTLVWVTRYQQVIFDDKYLRMEMADIIRTIAALNDILIDNLEVKKNYIHMDISFDPNYAATNVVKALKGASARLFFESHPDIKNENQWQGHLWSHNYYLSTVGTTNQADIDTYVANQNTK